MDYISDEAVIRRYELLLKDIHKEKKELLAELKYLYQEEMKLHKWICELKGEEFVK